MSTETWAAELRKLANDTPDIVTILSTMSARHEDFRNRTMVSAMAAREGLGISVRQVNALIGWLKDEVGDEALRREIPIVV